MEYLWLCLSAVAAGAVNAVAGGGTLLTYPPLESFVGVAAVANATSTLSLCPGSFASVWGFRKMLPSLKRWIIWLWPPSILGGILGATLVALYPDAFRALVPWLILTAAVLFLLQPTIARWLKHPHLAEPSRRAMLVIAILQFFIGVYGGYFGAGIGILMLSTLSFLGLKDIHHTNALKTFLAAGMNIVAAVVFIVSADLVRWNYALAMAVAAIVGGYLGARWSLLLRPSIVRWIVIAIGFGLAAFYLAREFGVSAVNV